MGKIFTIGHSNRTKDEFISLLLQHQIDLVVDVRSIPKSRHVPWSNQPTLKKFLTNHKISYTHLLSLGGRRYAKSTSKNLGWRNKSFRGYADYMQTSDFFLGLKELHTLQKKYNRLVILCAEAVPWRCHRSLISDALLIRKKNVWHIINASGVKKHQLTSFAKIDKTKRPLILSYPERVSPQ